MIKQMYVRRDDLYYLVEEVGVANIILVTPVACEYTDDTVLVNKFLIVYHSI